MSRLVVVGAGLGGCIAAITACRTEPDVDVTLVSTAPEQYRHEPGTVDVLGAVEDQEEPVTRPLAGLSTLPETHPYTVLGEETVQEALSLFDSVLVDDDQLPYRSGGEKNALVPTLSGAVRPTSRYPAGLAAGLVSSDRPMRLIGFDGLPQFDAELAADRLDSTVKFDVSVSTVEVPFDTDQSPRTIARMLEDTDDSASGRDALADRIRPELDTEPRVGVPAVLGIDDHESVRGDLESRLQADLFEIPVGEPNLPGLRLRNRLFELADAAGVERLDAPVADVTTDGNSLTGLDLEAETPQQTVDGDQFLLATGGLAAGGLVERGGELVEPVFGCPVSSPDDRSEWSEQDPLGDHQFARFGVDVTERLQPVGSDGPYYENLYAVGATIGGHNYLRERSRGGVEIATGYQATRNALDTE